MPSPTLLISGLHLSIPSVFLFILISNLLPVVHSLSFNITSFDPESSNKILLEGDAKFSFGVIQLTTDSSLHVGRVVASEPLQLYDSSSGTTAHFTTRFSFTYDIVDNSTDDGLAFFLAPFGYPIPPNSAGQYFGLLNSSINSGTSRNQILMVEFDSFPNTGSTDFWDPKVPHVGININSVASVKYVPWDFISNSGKPATVLISYNATTKNLSVSWSYEDSSVPLTHSSISHIVDLKGLLPEFLTVGISAATGINKVGHAVNFWEFSSTLNAKNMSRKKAVNKKVLVAVVVVAVSLFMLLVGTGIYWLVIKKKMRKKNDKHEEDQKESVLVNKGLEKGALPRKFSYQELITATDGFAEDRKLGKGGSGQVYKGMLNDIDRQVAVKRIFQEFDHSERIFINEVRIISRLIHRNLVQFIGWCHEQDEFLLVYEYMPNGCLYANLFGNRRTLPWEVRYKIVLGLASAINYLHEEAEQCVLHRDIKSANVLLDADFSTKLGDFGVAKLVDTRMRTQMTGVVGTFGYLAPEYAIEGRASKESDMYSFGVVALEIACGKRSFQDGEYHVPLMKRVWDLYVEGNIIQAADEGLEMKFDPNEMKRLLMVGLWCTHLKDNERPKAGQVIKALQLDSPMLELPQDMHYPAIQPISLQQNGIGYLQPPITSTVIYSGR